MNRRFARSILTLYILTLLLIIKQASLLLYATMHWTFPSCFRIPKLFLAHCLTLKLSYVTLNLVYVQCCKDQWLIGIGFGRSKDQAIHLFQAIEHNMREEGGKTLNPDKGKGYGGQDKGATTRILYSSIVTTFTQHVSSPHINIPPKTLKILMVDHSQRQKKISFINNLIRAYQEKWPIARSLGKNWL